MFRNRVLLSEYVNNSIHVDIRCTEDGASQVSPKKMSKIISSGLFLPLLGMMGLIGCSLAEPCDIEHGQFLSSEGCVECPISEGYHYETKGEQHICVVDSVERCGMQVADCTGLENVQKAVCVKGQCGIVNCKESYEKATRANKEEYCRSAAVDKCGDDELNCNDINGVKNAKCIGGECLIMECDEAHKLAINKEGTRYCQGKTAENCGEKAVDCTSISGVNEAECDESGECRILNCEDGYDLISNQCVENEITQCGENKRNCADLVNEWYPGEQYKGVATPICQDGKDCAFVCGSYILNDVVYNSALISCTDYLKNPAEYGDEFASKCQNNEEFEFCLPYQCPRPEAGQIQKVVKGECGCGELEDIEDSDMDGVINCNDDCPNNPTKQTLNEGDVCSERDTDGDGINDKDDICPTRKNSEIKDIISALAGEKKCDNDGRVLASLDDVEKAKLCGVYIENGDSIDEFHIYNALDLEALKSVLRSINNELNCKSDDSTACITESIGRKCVDGIYYSYKYSASGTTSASLNCRYDFDGDKSNNPADSAKAALEFSQLRVTLENDINLNDINETIIRKDLDGNMQCYGMWASDFDFIGVEFDGKGHTIRYYPKDDVSTSLRCDLINSLFGNMTLSRIHNIKLDFGVKFYGRGLLARNISSSSLEDIEIKNGLVETTVIGNEGVGLLAGSYETGKSMPDRISIFPNKSEYPAIKNIISDHVSVIAPLADNVGGLFGQFTVKNFNLSLSDYIVEQVQGNNNVGGLFGYIKDSTIMNLGIYCDNSGNVNSCINSVNGSNYVGGVTGYFNNGTYKLIKIDCKETLKDTKSCIQSVAGNDNIGGLAGRIDVIGDIHKPDVLYGDTILRKVHKIDGNAYVGGFAGYISDVHINSFDLTIDEISGKEYVGGVFGQVSATSFIGYNNSVEDRANLNVFSKKITGDDYVGGVVGYCQYCRFRGLMNSQTEKIEGKRSVGGVYGMYGSDTHDHQFNYIYNKVDAISGNHGVGGLIGSIYSDKVAINMHDVYNDVSTISATGENPLDFSGLVGEILFDRNSLNSVSKLDISLQFVYSHIGSFSPGTRAGGVIGGMHEIFKDDNLFQHANISMNNMHIEIDNYDASYPKSGLDGGIIGRLNQNAVWIQSASIFINYINNGYYDVYSALFQDEGTTTGSFNSGDFSGAFSVKRTDKDLVSCEGETQLCSTKGLNLAQMCTASPQLDATNHTCKYYMRSGGVMDWAQSSFKLGGNDESIPSVRKTVIEDLKGTGVLSSSFE